MLPPHVRRIEVPTGFPIGTVNAYAFVRPPVTLVDPGCAVPGALEALAGGLGDAGLRLEDIEQIVLTHGHVDHLGLAARVREVSGARVLAPAAETDLVEHFQDFFRGQVLLYGALFAKAGAPPKVRRGLEQMLAPFLSLGEGVRVDRPLEEGGSFEAGGDLVTALRSPGHTLGSMAYLTSSGLLLAGDTAIPGITPIAASVGRGAGAPGLGEYLASLDRLSVQPARLLLPGHREPFEDLRGYVREVRRLYRQRRGRILSLLQGERTAWEIGLELLGPAEGGEVLLRTVEALGQLELLESEGAVAARPDGAVLRFRSRP